LDGIVKFLGLRKVKLKLAGLSFALLSHVSLPLLSALLHPLLHETGVTLQLVYLNAAHFLFETDVLITVAGVELGGNSRLPITLLFKPLEMNFKVNFLLGAVKFCQTLFEKFVAHLIILGLACHDFLGGLVVTKLARLRHDRNVGGWVHLLEYHLDLVEETKGQATFTSHHLLDRLRVELDF
jgi:hypothetical protein